jgi:hypothetical protein
VIENTSLVCEKSGFELNDAYRAEEIATRLNCFILFREPGEMAGGLIKEGYGMKGFRIDTKSCTWGPMAGFVCMDPRLTKSREYVLRNKQWTHEALSGEINKKFFGDNVTDKDWVGDVAPIVISQERIQFLRERSVIRPRKEGNDLVGVSGSPERDVVLPWRLIPVGTNERPLWLTNGNATPEHHVLCIDRGNFKQQYPNQHGLVTPTAPVMFAGYETVLGLCNPQTAARFGFKACVTADYDLFSIWPRLTSSGVDLMDERHFAGATIAQLKGAPQGKVMASGVPRLLSIDQRLKKSGHQEHHRFGDVSARVMIVKTLLNSAFQRAVGNAVHHNDEAGNFALAKGSLKECLPIVAFTFTISAGSHLNGPVSQPQSGRGYTALVQTLDDFKTLVEAAREEGCSVVAKPEWLQQAGVQ